MLADPLIVGKHDGQVRDPVRAHNRLEDNKGQHLSRKTQKTTKENGIVAMVSGVFAHRIIRPTALLSKKPKERMTFSKHFKQQTRATPLFSPACLLHGRFRFGLHLEVACFGAVLEGVFRGKGFEESLGS